MQINNTLLGFFYGITLALLISGFIITKNPNHIPIILKYSATDAFKKINTQNKSGIYSNNFSKFISLYNNTRALLLVAFSSFCLLLSVMIVTQVFV